eukprot:scaffold6230_cov127-Isochrysis_galbana.AAC.10
MHPERGAGLVGPADQLKLQLHAPFSEHCARLAVPGLKLGVLATHLGWQVWSRHWHHVTRTVTTMLDTRRTAPHQRQRLYCATGHAQHGLGRCMVVAPNRTVTRCAVSVNTRCAVSVNVTHGASHNSSHPCGCAGCDRFS